MFKKGAGTDPKNYRDIPLLRLVSKIIKKSIHFQIEDCVNNKKTNLHVSLSLLNKPFNRLLSGSVDKLCLV